MSFSPLTVKDSDQEQNNFTFWRDISKLQGQEIVVTDTGLINTDFTVQHTLGTVPESVEIVIRPGQTDAYLAIKPGSVAWTKTAITLKCNTANANIKLRIR